MYSFEGLLGGGIGGGATGATNRARSFRAPRDSLQGPKILPKQSVTTRAVAANAMYFRRLLCSTRTVCLRRTVFFFDINFCSLLARFALSLKAHTPTAYSPTAVSLLNASFVGKEPCCL